MSAISVTYDEYWDDIKAALSRPLSEKALAARLKKVVDEEAKLQKILEYFQTKNLVRSHCYGSVESSLVLYYLPVESSIVSSPVPSLKLPEPEKVCSTNTTDIEDAKENGEVNSSTPPSSQSKSNPVTPAKQSPGNHLNKPMSDSLRQKLKRRRPLHSPTPSNTGSDEVSGESPVKKQRTSLHGPPRNIHAGDVSEREKERRLRVELFEKKSGLEKLKKKIQSKKNSLAKRDEIEHLTALISKWRSVCQEALMELLAHQNRHSIEPVSLGQLLQTFHIESSLLNYTADIDAFNHEDEVTINCKYALYIFIMEVPGSGQHCFQQLSEFQKQLDAAVAAHQQRLKNTSHIDIDVNGIHLERLKLDWIFEKVEETDPLFPDLTLLRLYIIAKLFNLSNSTKKLDGESMSHIQQFVKHIVDVRMPSIIGWLESTDEHIGYAAINTLIDICFSPAASHITANLYMDLVRLTTTNQGSSARTLALFIKELKLALKSIKVETDDGEINKNNVQYLEAMKILFLFGNSAEVRVALLKRNNEDNVRANIELYILMLKLLTYLNEEHVSAQNALNFKLNVVRDCLPVLGQQITAAYSHLTIKKYLRLCSQLISVLSLADLHHTMNTLYPLIGRIFNESTDNNEPSIFGHQTVLATRRLFILLVQDITKNLLANLTSADHVALELSRIGSALVSLLRDLSPKQLLEGFFDLFQEQDDDLMTGLWHWLSVSTQWSESTTQAALGSKLPRELIESITRIVSTFTPHAMFHEFLAIVDYDHNVLLDFLVSNETDFLLYFLQYLKHVAADWTGFSKTMAQFDSNEAAQYLEEAQNSDMSEESKRELEEMLLSMSKLKLNTNTMQVDSNEVKRVMDVINKLGVAINRLVAKDLFPYNIAPLLKWIANAEQLYNQK